jgi:hypothetical protein
MLIDLVPIWTAILGLAVFYAANVAAVRPFVERLGGLAADHAHL